VRVELRYGGRGISYLNVLDFIANSQQARIVRSSQALPEQTIEVSYDDWVFPKSGVAFVWALQAGSPTQNGGER
jgi:hypothetical protein